MKHGFRGAWAFLGLLALVLGAAPAAAQHSAARIWNDQLLDAIRTDIPKPGVHARNLYHVSVAMWDAWAAYDPVAQGVISTEKAPLQAPVGMIMPDPLLVESSGLSGGFKSLMAEDDPAGYDEQKKKKKGGDDEYGDDEDGDGGGDDDEDGDGTACGNDDDEDAEPVAEKIYDAAVEAARAETISFAAYRVLQYRFPTGTTCHPGAGAAHAAFDAQMDALGYDRTFVSTVGDSPAALGNRIAAAVIAHGQTDGSNEGPSKCYPDDTGYFPSNPDLIFKLPGNPSMIEPNHWQPLAFDMLILQNGIIIGAASQTFVGVGWGDVTPFAVGPEDIPPPLGPLPCWTVFGVPQPYFDPGCPPQLAGEGDATLKQAMLENIRFSSWTDPADGYMVDISPGVRGNNSLGADDGSGHAINPVTCEPYAPNLVKRADWVRVVAQSWSDGPKSETPPGHWNVLANEVVADNPAHVRRIGGSGPLVNALEWDAKTYLALNGSVHDAAISAWSTKNYYDSSRPIALIRYMAGLGQSSDPGQLSYHPDGLLLEPGLVEVVTEESVQPGGKFESLKGFCAGGGPATNTGLPCDQLDADHDDSQCPNDGPYDGYCQSSVGKIAIFAWLGPPADSVNTTAGVGWRLAETWMPWFPKTFVTPPFPGYTSGHSTFSRSGAEVMAAITGTPYFPGGIGHFDALVNEYIEVEDGPTQDLQLQWATYFDAADEAGISRRFGGIHPFYDDFPGRIMGSQIGQKAWAKAQEYYDPGVPGPGGGGANAPETDAKNDGYSGVTAKQGGEASEQKASAPVAKPQPTPRTGQRPAATRSLGAGRAARSTAAAPAPTPSHGGVEQAPKGPRSRGQGR